MHLFMFFIDLDFSGVIFCLMIGLTPILIAVVGAISFFIACWQAINNKRAVIEQSAAAYALAASPVTILNLIVFYKVFASGLPLNLFGLNREMLDLISPAYPIVSLILWIICARALKMRRVNF